MNSVRDYTFGEVAELLAQRMESLCDALGLRGVTQGHVLLPLNPTRADTNPGSFVVQISGSRAGRWNEYAPTDFPAGDALDLVALVKFGGPDSKAARREAFNWARRWLGLGDAGVMTGGTEKLERARQDAAAKKVQAEAEIAAMLAKKRRSAMSMWLQAQKLEPPGLTGKSSPAWAYFNECRGLPLDQLARLPSAVKWTAAARHVESDRTVPAIVSAMFMPNGELVAVHRIFLEPDGLAKIQVPKGQPVKKIWPAGYMGAVIPISRGASGLPPAVAQERGIRDEWFYCEGVEDGFTAAILAPEWRVNVVGTARNFEHVEPGECAGAVIAGRDNDPDPKVRKGVAKSISELRRKALNRDLPFFITAAKGAKDFNDMVRG